MTAQLDTLLRPTIVVPSSRSLDGAGDLEALKTVQIGIEEDKAGRIKALVDKYLSQSSTLVGLEDTRRKMGIPISGLILATLGRT